MLAKTTATFVNTDPMWQNEPTAMVSLDFFFLWGDDQKILQPTDCLGEAAASYLVLLRHQ